MTKGLKNTEGNIIVVKEYNFNYSVNVRELNIIHIYASMYKDVQHALRDVNGTLEEWDYPIKRKSWSVDDVISKMTMTSALPLGEFLHETIYDFILTKVGAGWTKI